MDVVKNIIESFNFNRDRNSFFINEKFYSYADFNQVINGIRSLIKTNISTSQKNVGLITNNDVETYASIFALWLEGKAYVPISTTAPKKRNLFVLSQIESETILDSSSKSIYSSDCVVINTNTVSGESDFLEIATSSSQTDLAYIIFTSGSTGQPKGVPITFKNLNALISAMQADSNQDIFPDDRCLQMFELTFDYSVVTYLIPLINGACVYTIPRNQIKHFYIIKLLEKHQLTHLVMVASVIHFLRPYFSEIKFECVRYCCFGASPLQLDVFLEWQDCLPNANFYNSYGPTEYTVTTTYYKLERNEKIKIRNGIIALGNVLQDVTAMVVDEELSTVPNGHEGELCLSGKQMTKGYWKSPDKNRMSFFEKDYKGKLRRFYKTGDLCILDDDGCIKFIGRKDFQVKIRGYRVELSEIEYYALQHTNKNRVVAIDVTDAMGNTNIILVINEPKTDTTELHNYLKEKLPEYMIPSKYEFLDELPLNQNGKIDRNRLKEIYK